ncbi:sarcosine oxidase subunit delta [Steroidobacter sp.]|uniref:sarcosine oxidase subunit delta n=1 Tax=Steroidobacter sp. TaxID=1978227 RepID=UPI0032C2417A
MIRCPYCTELRTEEELVYGGEADLVRPAETSSDQEWTDYLFMRANLKGVHHEQWCCSAGCGQWFKVVRDTVSHKVLHVRKFEELPQPATEVV